MITPQQTQLYSGVKLKLEVELDRFTMTLREVLELRAGGLIHLNKSLGDNLNVRVGGTALGEGEIILLEQRMALRLAHLIPMNSAARVKP
ncbi:MAG: FliM/FliN family flagellar motor switch protein [Acidobacteria bacterium]|nr:FliM/FliN family flagellar motor switch protein [Acidobacteriota bacterium]